MPPPTSRNPKRTIQVSFFTWLACVLGALICFSLIVPSGRSEKDYGLNRAIPVSALSALSVATSFIAALKTRLHRQLLSRSLKSMGYSPLLFSLTVLGTLAHGILTGDWIFNAFGN